MHELITKLKKAKHCVAFTGAGSSTLSGIRDFRGKNGIYKEYDAEKIFSIHYFMQNPSEFYKIAKTFFYNLDEKEPNIIHTECARLEKMGIIKRVITQNIVNNQPTPLDSIAALRYESLEAVFEFLKNNLR